MTTEIKKQETKRLFSPFSTFAFLVFFSVIISNFYFFYFKKDYDFIVETSCNSEFEECFERDCTNPDDCPPNELSLFKRYSLQASDFIYCENEDCTFACESGKIECEKIECEPNEEYGESCTYLSGEIEEEFLEAEVEDSDLIENITEEEQ